MIQLAELSLGILENVLRPCLAWHCDLISNPPKDVSKGFRSALLEPLAKSAFPHSCHTTNAEGFEERFSAFLRARDSLAPPYVVGTAFVAKEVKREKSLLITDWSASLFDGALAPETDGFLDNDGMPPWDTWCALIKVDDSVGKACLLSWVPTWISKKVDVAIQIDAAESLSWIKVSDDMPSELTGWGVRWAA